MATIDASIPLSYQFPQLPTAQSVEQAKQLQYRNQLAQLQLDQAQQESSERNAMLGILRQPGAIGPDGLPTNDAVGKITSASPEMGTKLMNSLAEIRARQQEAQTNFINQRLLNLKIGNDQHDRLVDIATQAQVRYEGLLKQGVNPTEAAKTVSDERNNAIDAAVKDGTLLPDQAQQLRIPFEPNLNKSFIAGSKQYKTVLDEQDKAQKEQLAEQREDRIASSAERTANAAEQRATAAEETPFMKEAAATYGKDSPEYQKALKDHLAKESSSGGTGYGGREAVFTNRALSSASLASRDLANIARGPVTQSSGIFGGRSQGPSLTDATYEQLANKITSQEAQTYNVKIAGLQRNLATLESQGLAPSGSLTHQMDAIVFKDSDTYLTKAYKLAEARQIVEGGMDVILSNDRVPDSTKNLARQLVKSVQTSVPYTVEDLDMYANSGKKGKTIGQFLGKAPADKESAAIGQSQYTQSNPARPKSKADYDSLPSGSWVVLPNGKEGQKP